MGKTSVESRFNLPGRIGWMIMECPGFLTLLYVMNTLPALQGVTDLPWQNKVLGGLFVGSRARSPHVSPPARSTDLGSSGGAL